MGYTQRSFHTIIDLLSCVGVSFRVIQFVVVFRSHIFMFSLIFQKWELLVLLKLKWDMAAVTPQDFLALLVARLPIKPFVEPEMVIKHAQTFVSLAIRGELHFVFLFILTFCIFCVTTMTI